MINPIKDTTRKMLIGFIESVEKEFDADCIFINGPIVGDLVSLSKDSIEELAREKQYRKLCVLLTTNGGDVTTAERLVNIFRHHYSKVEFIVPDHAYSAGTLLCMSGDKIWMDYNSVLGPIDPQVLNKENKMYVPASGYVDKIRELLKKAQNNTISEAEFLILKDFDLAELSLYEQALELTVVLLQEWLAKYKFKDWETHSSTGQKVTKAEKTARAKQIAEELGNYSRWKTHGRPLNIEALTSLKLQIDDYSNDKKKSEIISSFYNMAADFMLLSQTDALIFTRRM